MVSDKLVYDVIGFSCLSVYSVAFFYVGSVRAEYRDHNNGNNPKVAVNDVFFALHALLFAFVQIGQMCYYDGKKQYPSLLCLRSSAVVSFIIVLYLVLVLTIDSSVFIFLYWGDSCKIHAPSLPKQRAKVHNWLEYHCMYTGLDRKYAQYITAHVGLQ
jgi:hypothetical protein